MKSASSEGVELEEYPGRTFRFSSLGMKMADLVADELGRRNDVTRAQAVRDARPAGRFLPATTPRASPAGHIKTPARAGRPPRPRRAARPGQASPGRRNSSPAEGHQSPSTLPGAPQPARRNRTICPAAQPSGCPVVPVGAGNWYVTAVQEQEEKDLFSFRGEGIRGRSGSGTDGQSRERKPSQSARRPRRLRGRKTGPEPVNSSVQIKVSESVWAEKPFGTSMPGKASANRVRKPHHRYIHTIYACV